MPTTRSQAAEERAPRVYEDCPASPSVRTSVYVPASRPVAITATMDPIASEITQTREPVGNAERVSRAPSVHSHRSTASAIARIRQAELEAEEQLAEVRRQELLLQANLIKRRLAADVATIREETDRESLGGDEAVNTNQKVDSWLRNVHIRGERERDVDRDQSPRRAIPQAAEPHRLPSPERAVGPKSQPTPYQSKKQGIERLAETLETMMRRRAPPRQTQDLPNFSGAAGEWLPFKAAMRESTSLHGFSPAENLARLRACLKGAAREAVSALLYTATDPSKIMQTLEQCFGRPETIIDQALDDIRKLPRVGTSAAELNNFAIKLQNIVTVITCLDERGYLLNPMLARQVTEKLSPHIKSKWCDYAEEFVHSKEPELVTLSHFLMREADRAIRHTYSSAAAPITTQTATKIMPGNRERRNERNNKQVRGANVYAATEKTPVKLTCLCCGAEHKTTSCHKLTAMPVVKRWDWAKETRICFQCLASKHRRFQCRAKRCGVDECRQSHHALLHPQSVTETAEAVEECVTATLTSQRPEHYGQVLLKICPVTLSGPKGDYDTYALFDEGSTITLLDEEIAGIIGAQGPPQALNIHGITSSQRELNSRAVEVKIRGRGQTKYQPLKARTVGGLAITNQSIKAELLSEEYLRELRPEDVCYAHAKPRLLIGADNWHLIVTRKLLTGAKGQPAASLTELGWVLHGTIPRSVVSCSDAAVLHIRTAQEECRRNNTETDDLHQLVKSHFDIDALGVSHTRKPVAKEERAKEIVARTTRHVNGQYEVGLPWNSDDVTLPPSYDMAMRRLRSIERKMDRSPSFKAAYTKQVEALLDKNYASVSKHDDNPRTWYLPHFAVTNPNKPGKVRMVFDAAARADDVCLNDALLDGPDLLQALHGILFRFRENPVAVTADIREMFLRIKIRGEDRVAQQFLWRGNDRTRPPQKYVMTSMIFGARCSPYIAHHVKNTNASNHRESHPLAYDAILHSHYMDDWVDSFDSEEIALQAIAEVQEVHAKAGFELAGWGCNRPHLLEGIPDDNKAIAPKELGANASVFGKTLGLLWLPNSDQLAFNTAMHRVPEEVKRDARTPTKREALSAVMSLFDPLGLVSPYTITAKIMLQGLWQQKLGWDDPLPLEEALIFSDWKADLKYIDDLRLPRCYELNKNNARNIQLHVFCDASEQAYAAAAYWRFERDDGSIHVIIVAGKAKVTPIKAQTIPRLELQACLIGARLARDIVSEHRIKPEVILWSDSKTVLQWIRSDSARYTPYIAHRLGEIAELTQAEQWRWVPTTHNVADDATRIGKTQLHSDDRWFVGPSFLYEQAQCWPNEVTFGNDHTETVAHATEKVSLIETERFSSYEKLVRTVSCVLTFAHRCQKRSGRSRLELLKEAELVLIRQIQRDNFPDDLARLGNGKCLDRTSRLYKLDPKYGTDRVIRLNGRINAAMVPETMKEPPILDGMHHVTRLLIRREHNRSHAGQEQIVNNMRQNYWILRLRSTVKNVLRNCTQCKLRRAMPVVPIKGNLPEIRLGAYTRPFSRCGLDCFGPMWVTIGRRREKRWGMIFTCLVTRAIHIELVVSLSTDSAIMAIRRMAARRGWPEIFLSDNGTNFHGAEVELGNAFKEWLPSLQEVALNKRIKWRFIDPGAPNQGGVWERLIRSVKSALAVTLTEKSPKEEVLTTVLTEIEHTVNSRPLTHVSVNPDDPEALTPNHFLLGTATGVPYVGECEAADKRAWRAAQALANAFWARWIREYLPTLAPRGDIRKTSRNIAVGDIVIIADGLLPRNVWPWGRVERVYTGPDDVVRSADVWTRGGVFRRPVRRLIVLPLDK